MRYILIALALALMGQTAHAQCPGGICPRPVLGFQLRETRQPTRRFAQSEPASNAYKLPAAEVRHARPLEHRQKFRPLRNLLKGRSCRRGGCG